MKTFFWEDSEPIEGEIHAGSDGGPVYIHHQEDFSGDASIDVPVEMYRRIIQTVHTSHDGTRVMFKLPAQLMEGFGRQATLKEVMDYLKELQ